MNRMRNVGRIASIPLTFCLLLLVPSILADGGGNHQQRNTHFGVSGGNVNDSSKAFCCSGTLGALLTDGKTKYVLSNNHVLGRSDQATVGDDISQPGLIDNGCRVSTVVADFTTAVPFGSNVDAAIAQLRDGTMDSSGFIEDIGVPCSTVVSASVGLGVAKSGRTTGTTTGTVGSINTSVNVQYQKGCGSGRKFVVSYTNQVVINSGSFSAGGDSGSLIVTNDTSHNPVALLYAGSSSTTIGNPIGEVLDQLSARLGSSLSFVGTCGGGGGGRHLRISPRGVILPQIPSEVIEFATRVKEEREAELMSRSSVIGVGVGTSETNEMGAAIMIYVDKTTGVTPKLPKKIKGVDVQVIYTEPFFAY
jgi:hypothetical protein